MNGYFISITNNLLEDKHYEAMGQSVWLYMWLIDKMTDISEGQGIVNGGYPISYEQVRTNLPSLSERTYHRMVATLRDAGYINTVKAKYGLYITINKAKKQFGKKAESSPAKNGLTKPKKTLSPAKNGNGDLPKMSASPAKNGRSLYKKTITNTNTTNNTSKAIKSPDHEKISKLYYETIKELGLPVRNHTVLKTKIKALAKETDVGKVCAYLGWVRDKYARTEWDFKPQLNEALDIYTKRVQIENSLKQFAKQQEENKVLRI